MEQLRSWFSKWVFLALSLLLSGCGGGDSFTANPPSRVTQAAVVTPFVVSPQRGWWWDPNEGGSGYAIEVQGNQIFLAAFLYEANGASTWYVSTLTQQADNSYTGTLARYQGGQTLLGAYKSPTSANTANVTLAFTSATAGKLQIQPVAGGAGRTVSLSRFPISTPACFAKANSGFESGWWWNADQGGRGFFIEVQGSQAFVGAFMYDASGQPTWYVSWATVLNGAIVSGPLLQYSNGQSLTGAWRAPTQAPATAGTLSFNLNSPSAGTMTLPNGTNVPMTRFVFNANGTTPPEAGTGATSLAPQIYTDFAEARDYYGVGPDGQGGDGDGDGGAAGDGAGDGGALTKSIVTLTAANGKKYSGFTDCSGKFLLRYKTRDVTAPMVLRVVDSGGNVVSSVIDEVAPAGKVSWSQVNPLTDKIVSDSLKGSVAGTDQVFDGSGVDTAKLGKAKSDLVGSIKDALAVAGITDTSTFDPVRSKYRYDGTGVDAILESVVHTRDSVTGATQLQAKMPGLQNTSGGAAVRTLVSAATPLTSINLVNPNSTALTFSKIGAWVAEMNRCFALSYATRAADADCVDADGSRLVSQSYVENGKDFQQDFRVLYSTGNGAAIQGSEIRNVTVLYTGKYPGSTAAYNDYAVVNMTIRQPFTGQGQYALGLELPTGLQSVGPIEYSRTAVFKRDDRLVRAKAGNWILYGNQHNFDVLLSTRYTKITQLNPSVDFNGIGGSPSRYETGLQISVPYVVYDRYSRQYVYTNVRAMRITGPGLPASGLVLTPSTVPGLNGMFAILNKNGSIPPSLGLNPESANAFVLASVQPNGLPTSPGVYGVGHPVQAEPQVTDFQPLQTFAQYKCEFFYRSNTSGFPDAIEYFNNRSSVSPPSSLFNARWNDLSPSLSLVTPIAPAASALQVNWTNTANAGAVFNAAVSTHLNEVGLNFYSGYSTGTPPTSIWISAPTNQVFPALGISKPDRRALSIFSRQSRALYESVLAWDN